MITLEQLAHIMPANDAPLSVYFDPLNAAMGSFQIDNPHRAAAFLAQIAEESNQLREIREESDGAEYEGSTILGNTQPGDGAKFIGRGPGQVTGRWMYGAVGRALGLPLLEQPELLEQPANGSRAAAWIWAVEKKLNPHADADDFGTCCSRWNGGYNGLDSRIKYYLRAREALGL